jgi:hypothetical protein
MALIAVAADKGAPGVTTSALALAAVWPRPVLLAECDPAGGDIVYRLPGAGGTRLDPWRGLLSLAVTARRGVTPAQIWEHVQKLRGGLDVLLGVATAEQGSSLDPLWDAIGAALAALPGADVIADCGRLGPDGPYYGLLGHAAAVVLVVQPSLGEVIRLRDRAAALSAAVGRRGRHDGPIGLLVVVEHRGFGAALAEVGQAVGYPGSPVSVLGAVAYEPRSAELLRGEWSGKLRKSLLIRTAGEVTTRLVSEWLIAVGQPAGARPATEPSAAGPVTWPAPQSAPPWPVLDGTDPRPTIPPHTARPRHAAGRPGRRMPPGVVPVDGLAPLDGRAAADGPGPGADLAPLPAPPGPAAPGPARPRRSRVLGRGRHAQPRDGRAADRGES